MTSFSKQQLIEKLVDIVYALSAHFQHTANKVMGFRIMGVKGVVVSPGEQVLLIQHNFGNRQKWQLPGGGVKRRETLAEAIIRETNEEIGISVVPHHIISMEFSQYNPGSFIATFFCSCEENVISPDHLNYEIAEVKWFPINNLPPEVTRSARRRIEFYIEGRQGHFGLLTG